MEVAAYVYLSTVFMILLGLAVIIRMTCKEEKMGRRRRRSSRRQRTSNTGNQRREVEFVDYSQSDQNNIYNISGSVQGQNQHAYPDAYLSIDHIAITNELNKPPPKYDDAPPSYEEALKLAMAHSNSLQTYQSEQGHSADLPRTHLPAGSSID